MKCFKLHNGDCVINKDIALEYDADLIATKIKQVLSTNLGEWEYNEGEGIDFYAVVTKNPNFDLIRDYVKDGIAQVDETLELTEFECIENKQERTLTINITITKEDGEDIAVNITL